MKNNINVESSNMEEKGKMVLTINIPEHDNNQIFTDITVFHPGCSHRQQIRLYRLTIHDIGELSHRLLEIYQEVVLQEDFENDQNAEAQIEAQHIQEDWKERHNTEAVHDK